MVFYLLISFIAGKRICNSLAGSYELRTNIADVHYNTNCHSGSKINEFIFGESYPLLEKMEADRKRKCLKNAISKASKKKRIVSDEPPNKKKKTKDYGDGHGDVDMSQSAYDIAKTRFLERLERNQSDRENIQIETRAQNHSFRFIEVRRLLLTSSYFGRVLRVRGRSSFTKIVEEILYKNSRFANTADGRHQKIYEQEGLSIFCGLYKDEPVLRCGIFIDGKYPFLGNIIFGLSFLS